MYHVTQIMIEMVHTPVLTNDLNITNTFLSIHVVYLITNCWYNKNLFPS